MLRVQDYPDVSGSKNRSVLPEDLQRQIGKLSEKIQFNRDVTTVLSEVLSGLENLPAQAVVRAAADIAHADHFCGMPSSKVLSTIQFRILGYRTRASDLNALKKNADLSEFLIFSHDGFVREAALKAIIRPPSNPFAFAALCARLNDWVPQVRAAACNCAERVFPITPPEVIAKSSIFFVPHAENLGRWGEQERSQLYLALGREDVVDEVITLLMAATVGPIQRFFRFTLRRAHYDQKLPALARAAKLPGVRAIALDSLIRGKARWYSGFDYQWVDKRYGIRNRVPRVATRSITHNESVEDLLALGADDRATTVRRTISKCLVDLLSDWTPQMTIIAEKLARDERQSVREPARFCLTNQSQEG